MPAPKDDDPSAACADRNSARALLLGTLAPSPRHQRSTARGLRIASIGAWGPDRASLLPACCQPAASGRALGAAPWRNACLTRMRSTIRGYLIRRLIGGASTATQPITGRHPGQEPPCALSGLATDRCPGCPSGTVWPRVGMDWMR